MKLSRLAALALIAAPVFAQAATEVKIDFEKSWSYIEDVASTYASQGVEFDGFIGFSNDEVSVGYANAPSALGVAFVNSLVTSAYINVADGAVDSLSFYASAPSAVTGAVKVYDGLNGTGNLLGTFDLAASGNSSDAQGFSKYDAWIKQSFTFSGTAKSFDFSAATATAVGIDDITISAVPESSTALLMLAGVAGLAGLRRRRD